MQPFDMGGEMIAEGLDRRDDAGTSCRTSSRRERRRSSRRTEWAIAIDYITEVRVDKIEETGTSSSRRRWTGLPSSRGDDLRARRPTAAPGSSRSASRTCAPHDVAQILDWEGVAVRAGHHCTQPLMRHASASRRLTRAKAFHLYSLPGRLRPAHRGPAQGQREVSPHGMDQMYREVILDHYKNPRGHGVIEDADAEAEGLNPLCGDEVTIYVQFDEDGETIDEVKFSGRGCAISQASTSMLMEMARRAGRRPGVASMPKEELLEEIGIPLTPNSPKVRGPRPDDAQGRAAPGEGDAAAGRRRRARRPQVGRPLDARADRRRSARGPDRARTKRSSTPAGPSVGVYNCGGELYAIEDRCSHDDGPLCEGDWDDDKGRRDLPAPRRQVRPALRAALTLPAFEPVETYPCASTDRIVKVEVVET